VGLTRYLGIVFLNWLHSLVSGDVLFYVLFLFLPALFLVVICKHKPWKKLWSGIVTALPVIVCAFPFAFFVWTLWDASAPLLSLIIFFIYIAGGIVGYFFNIRRGRHWLLLLAGLFVACSIYAFLDSYPPKLFSFGSIVDESISEKQDDFDYEIRMELAKKNIMIDDYIMIESTIYDKRIVQLRVKKDSAFVCTSKETCGIRDTVETCEWIALKTNNDVVSIKDNNNQFFIKADSLYYLPLRGSDNLRQFYECCAEILEPFSLEIPFDVSPEKRTVSQIHLLKKLVESYNEEKVPYNMLDGYNFDIALLDYRRGVKRRIEIGNAMAAEPGDLPNAKRIDEIARAFLPITKNTPMDWRGEKCKK